MHVYQGNTEYVCIPLRYWLSYSTWHLTVCLMSHYPQVKLDEAQESEQEALRKQLKQEEELLEKFQESQKAKLAAQHERERQALDERVEKNKEQLEAEVCWLVLSWKSYTLKILTLSW